MANVCGPTGKTREIHKIVADAVADSQQWAAQVQALTGRYPLGGGKQIPGGSKKGPPSTTTPAPPAYDPADAADLFKKIDEWRRKNRVATEKVKTFNESWPDGITFDIRDPEQSARYQAWKREHDAAQLARSEVVQEYGEIIVEAGKFGGQADPDTGDIVWPDGSRTSIRPPE